MDAEEQQKRLEEQLRRRYEEDYERSRASPANGAARPAVAAQTASNGEAQDQQKSILDEYDPFRA